MKVDCDTCDGSEKCKGSIKWECVLLHKYIRWSPKDKTYCKRCRFGGSEGGCNRHAEPCVLNYFFYKEIKMKVR
jgi:hypothetical protein